MDLLPDDERVVVVAALVSYVLRMADLPYERQRAERVLAKFIGCDNRVYIRNERSTGPSSSPSGSDDAPGFV